MKSAILGLVIALAASAQATEIAVDLGAPNNNVTTELRVPFSTETFSLNGDHLLIDFVFGEKFIHLYSSTGTSFVILPMLQLYGTGTIADPTGSGYTTGADGLQNGGTWNYGLGGSVTAVDETFNFGLGYAFPLFSGPNGGRVGGNPADIYGLHLDITMPTSVDFTILGGQLLLATNASNPWDNKFAIGPHVPDSGSSIALFAIGLVALGALKARVA